MTSLGRSPRKPKESSARSKKRGKYATAGDFAAEIDPASETVEPEPKPLAEALPVEDDDYQIDVDSVPEATTATPEQQADDLDRNAKVSAYASASAATASAFVIDEPRPVKEPKPAKEPKPPREPRVKKERQPKPPREPKPAKEPKPPREPRVKKEPEPKPVKEPRPPREKKVRPPKVEKVRAEKVKAEKPVKTPKPPKMPKPPKIPSVNRANRIMLIAGIIGAIGLLLSVVLAIGALFVAADVAQGSAFFTHLADLCNLLVGPLKDVFHFTGVNADKKESLVGWGLGSMGYLLVGRFLQSVLQARVKG